MSLKLPDSIISSQDLKSLAQEVRSYNRWLSHGLIKQRAGGGEVDPRPALSPTTVTVIQDWAQGKPVSQSMMDDLILELEDFSETAPQLTITLAAPPAGGLKRILSNWCRQNIDPAILVNFSFDSTLLGGMVVRHGSHIFDWSFRRQILTNLPKFPEVMRRV